EMLAQLVAPMLRLQSIWSSHTMMAALPFASTCATSFYQSALRQNPLLSAAPACLSFGHQQIRGLKYYDKLRKRCRHCYFERNPAGFLTIQCPMHPRHKQQEKPRPPSPKWAFKRHIYKSVNW
ncbi:hypothetical protein BOX15_Mlig002462g2, partial [Macrostomum lignano]